MKKVLVISPYFAPTNAADMQRVRMSLPYFEEFGWDVEIVKVSQEYTDLPSDPYFLESITSEAVIHEVKALSKEITHKIGLGSIALRSIWFYWKKVNVLLKKNRYDLIYFSTTQFPICILGNYWKNKFGIPYVIDMQDPWYTDYYKNKPKSERPRKYWFSYRLNKYLEPIAMKKVGGLISVSSEYITDLKERYSHLKTIPDRTITFGAFDIDFQIAKNHDKTLELAFKADPETLNLVYVGRGGHDMRQAAEILFENLKHGLKQQRSLFDKIRFHFIGTSYAPKGQGIKTIYPIAEKIGVAAYVTEYADRIGFYQTLKNLKYADGLVILGSNHSSYTASKLYPYILAKRPLLAILARESSANSILKSCNAGELITIGENQSKAYEQFRLYVESVDHKRIPNTNWKEFEPYTSQAITKSQVELFNEVIKCQ
ncbi:ADP-heptose:LPS heptosyltransferase [Flavobacterium sp. W4I14]|nr:ADP-heptose:LPS heptosyltransferase [Flavobacterium sp. W4I14]